ncbi:bifunctional folylpolyglutamate synthase/dihydrofolate synthase [bacterium]|nr:bifunctional folylpolyglutamate synthase/dihydrofolate synthase [bacterium]
MPSFDYNAALNFLESLYDYEKNAHKKSPPPFHLEKISDVLKKLDNPQDKYKVIHIAGTKGKGSVAAMTTAILKRAGLKVGTYTSPHLIDIRERISIDDEPIDKKTFSEGIYAVKKVLGPRPKEYGTFFEVLTASAFYTFAKKNVDIAVVESGLGGRYDATNIVHPEIAILTRIGIDHTERLGNTITEIARDKAGIIKDNCCVITCAQNPEALCEIYSAAKGQNAKLFVCGKNFSLSIEKAELDGTDLKIEIAGKKHDVHLPLAGSFQGENAAVAAMCAHILNIDSSAIIKGLKNIRLRGRMEILSRNPLIIVDGAHNPTSAETTARELKSLKISPTVMVIAINSPKDFKNMILHWAEISKAFIFTSTGSPRSFQPEMLKKFTDEKAKQGIKSFAVNDRDEAIARAIEIAGKNGTIFIAGSLYLAGYYISKLEF